MAISSQNGMESLSVHAPSERARPSPVARPAPMSSSPGLARPNDATAVAKDKQDATTELPERPADAPSNPPPVSTAPQSPSPSASELPVRSLRSPHCPAIAVSSETDLVPLPQSFDLDAPPPPVPTVELPAELLIKPKAVELAPSAVDVETEGAMAQAEELAQKEEHLEVDPTMFGAIQDIQQAEYGGDDGADEREDSSLAPAPLSPIELDVDPISELPTTLMDVSSLSSDTPAELGPSPASTLVPKRKPPRTKSKSSTSKGKGKSASPAMAIGGDSTVKRKGDELVGSDEKRTKPTPKRKRAPGTADSRTPGNEFEGKTSAFQAYVCLRDPYQVWGKCVQCVAKVGGDACRFREYRLFTHNPETGAITSEGIFPSTELRSEMTPLPREFNTELTEEHMSRTEHAVAPVLLNLITMEMRHVINNTTIHRPVNAAEHRAVCDFCSGTLFAGFWFCRKCGREYCIYCERYISDSTTDLLASPWPIADRARPRLQRCTRGEEALPLLKEMSTRGAKHQHSRKDLQAASRFSPEELRVNWTALVNFVLEPRDDVDIGERLQLLGLNSDETELADMVREWFKSQRGKEPKETRRSRPPMLNAEIQHLYDESKKLPSVPDPTNLDTHPFMCVDGDELDDGLFDQLWARGEPLVVNNVGYKLHLDWSPDMFIKLFGPERCFVLDCETEEVHSTSIGQFFTLLKDPTRTEVYVPPPLSPLASPIKRTKSSKRSRTRGLDRSASAHSDDVPPPCPTAASGAQADGAASNSTPPVEGLLDTPNSDVFLVNEPNMASAAKDHTAASLPASETSFRKVEDDGPINGKKEDSATPTLEGGPGPPKKIIGGTLKLKDWPMTNDFSVSYPDLYADFCRALPAPNYTHRQGVMNLYAHFPPGSTRPDIGPKMYNAFAGKEGPGGQGSTRLHMDVADAVNIMLYAAPREDSSPGCAVWDLFRAEDADAIRDFLAKKFAVRANLFTDPIHSQMFYLDSDLRKELYDTCGVKSFRMYQYPGQAVFIPAGCAHQVCNLADCIKIALDFVSPHNVKRCQQLTQDFRKENFAVSKVWKEDVLQLQNVMWYAWTNVRETRERRAKEAAEAEAAHNAHLASLTSGSGADTLSSVLRRAQTSSVRDDPMPSAPRSTDDRDRATAATDAVPGNKNVEVSLGASSAAAPVCCPPAELVAKLMDAALKRQLEPVGHKLRDHPLSATPPPTTWPAATSPAPASRHEHATRAASRIAVGRPGRYRDMAERGHLPFDVAMNVLRADMGARADEDTQVDE